MRIRATRTARLRAAAVAAVVIAVVSIGAFDLPALAEGSTEGSDPFALVLGSFATDVLALVAAYGAYRRQRWGVIVLTIALSFWSVQALIALVEGEIALGGTMLVVTLVCLWCCLSPDRAPEVEERPVRPGASVADRAG